MHNRGGLGITERFKSATELCHRQSRGVGLFGRLLQFPPCISKATRGFRLLQGSHSCHATILLQMHPTGYAERQKAGAMGRDKKPWQRSVCSPSGLLQQWDGAQGCSRISELQVTFTLSEQNPPRSYHGQLHVAESLPSRAAGDRPHRYTHAWPPAMFSTRGKPGFLCGDKSKHHF